MAYTVEYRLSAKFPRGIIPAVFNAEILDDPVITTSLTGIRTDEDNDSCKIIFASEPSAVEKSQVGILATLHNRDYEHIVIDSALEPVEAGVSKVIANDRPAVEIQEAITGFGAGRFRWPVAKDQVATLCVEAQFILKETGTGSNVRIGVKAKANPTGSDTAGSFSPSGFVVVPVSFSTVGEVFEACIKLGGYGFEEGDAVAIQVGRDGNNEMGSGTDDDVDVPIQIIAVEVKKT